MAMEVKSNMRKLILICIFMISGLIGYAQDEIDSILPPDSSLLKISIVLPEFKLIDTDTIPLGEHDELICDSYTALGVPYVYDALHSFNRRRMDYFGGYLNVKVNAALERVRSKGYPSDVKDLFIQIDPKTLTVYWTAVVGPSEDGNCYACLDSRGSANGGLTAVNRQIPRMHSLYSGMDPVLLLDFNEDVVQCFEGDGTPLSSYCTYVNIRQKFYKYATDCVDDSTNTVIVSLNYNNTGHDTVLGDDTDLKILTTKASTPPYKKYKVRSGDTLSQIAQRHRTSVSAIKRLNHLKSDRINIGQILKIPT
jgi:LysM repeat protein